MSTYLVCIVIGQYDFVQTKANNRTTVRVYAPFGQREQGRYSLKVAKRCLEYFNDYFGKRYPLPKLDLVALNRLSGNMGCRVFKGGVQILEIFLPKNQHTQRKLLGCENWCSGEVSKSAKI